VLQRPVEFAQYTSVAFSERCKKMGVRPSMGTVGDAYDNAMAESFFASLECELIDRRSFKSKTGRGWPCSPGSSPWLRPLRSRSLGLVRRLRRYYCRVRLLQLVHHRLRLIHLPVPMRAAGLYGRRRSS